jgi:choline dehydrogenase-like flavoprotein
MENSQNFYDALSGQQPDELFTDICVVGAGACGITLARKLCAKKTGRVMLLESGPNRFDARTQALYGGRNTGINYTDLSVNRLRYFGGTTNHWAGFCAPVTARDFETVEGVALASWPIGFQEIEPYFEEAQRDLGFVAESCLPEKRLAAEGFEFREMSEDPVVTKLFTILDESAIRFGPRYRPQLKELENLEVFENLNLVHVQLSPDGQRVLHIQCKTLAGRTVKVNAKYFVLACHAIENARVLLASNDVNPKGVGNDRDFVGRCFMEHPAVAASVLKVHNPSALPRYLNTKLALKARLSASLCLSKKAEDKAKCLQYDCHLSPLTGPEVDKAHAALIRLNKKKNSPFEFSMLDDVKTVIGSLSESYKIVRRKARGDDPDTYLLFHRIEQSPNPQSRILLSDERDELGSRRADLYWQLSDDDIRTFQAGQDEVINYFGVHGIGRVEKFELERGFLEENVSSSYHHMGTTRMSAGATDGVVDPNCRVHGLDNLFIAGSSIFARGLYAGPTMSMLGFTNRLAAHLSTLPL